MVCRSTGGFDHLYHRVNPEDLALRTNQGGYGQCRLPGPRSNIQNSLAAANQPIFDERLRYRRKHLPDDFAVLLPERRRIAPCAYALLAGLHQQEYTRRWLTDISGTVPPLARPDSWRFRIQPVRMDCWINVRKRSLRT